MKNVKTIIIFINFIIFNVFNISESISSTDIKVVGFNYSKKFEQKTLTNSNSQNLSQSLIALTPGNLNLTGTGETIDLKFDYKESSFSINYATFNLRSKIDGNFNTDDASVVLKPIKLSIEHIYTGNTYSLAKIFKIIDTEKNWLNYNIGIGYQTGTLLSKNSVRVAFLNGKPKQQFTNNNIILHLGPKLKKRIAKNIYITGEYRISHSIYSGGELKAKVNSQSMSLGINYDLFEKGCKCESQDFRYKQNYLVELLGVRSNLFISGLLKTEEDNFSGSYDFTSAINLFSNELEARFLRPVNKKRYLLLAMNLATKKTKIKTETIPISGNHLDASAAFTLNEIGLKIGQRHYLTQQRPFTLYTSYGFKFVQSQTELNSIMSYQGKLENKTFSGSVLYGGLFTNLGFSKQINDDIYAFNEVGIEHYDGRPFGEPIFSIGSSFTIGLGLKL